jgi:LuxR family maltose regulon positive regulatory protein
MRSVVLARDPQQMRDEAAQALRLLAPASQWRGTAAAVLGLADLLNGDPDTADRHLADAVEVGRHLGAATATAAALAFRALIAIRRDDWPAAEALLQHAGSVIDRGRLHSYPTVALNHALLARTAVHRRDLETARREIAAAERLLPTLTRALASLAVPTSLELARAALALGDPPAAQTFLAHAQHVLADGLRFPVLQSDADELAAAITELRRPAGGPVRLTPAELRLLPLLATQHSLPEIAAQLYVSVHTVKAQVTSIYRKLGVSSRTQAIDRGRTLGLLPSPPSPPHRPASEQAPVGRVAQDR